MVKLNSNNSDNIVPAILITYSRHPATLTSLMASIEVIVPNFINCHLFWIIPKKNLLIRAAINRTLKAAQNVLIKDPNKFCEDEMVAVNVDGLWARAIINEIKVVSNYERKFICWLPDYGVKRIINHIFYLPDDMKQCPHLSKQASLHGVVNLMTDLTLGDTGYEFKLKKTPHHIEGVKKVALDCIESSEKILFSMCSEDEYNLYGDLIYMDENDKLQSLTDFLIKKKLLGVDKCMFEAIDVSRKHFKTMYYEQSQNWHQTLDTTEKNILPKIIFNKEINPIFPAMEFFKRNEIANRL